MSFLIPPSPQCKTCLLYADDTLLFLKPTQNQIVKAKILFDVFGSLSGLKVNLQKSELSVTCAAPSFTQNLAAIVQCKSASFPIKYLGLPLSDRRLTKQDYMPLLERMQTSLSGWRASLLSVGGRLILTNAVLTALPQYFMAMFLLPKWVTRRIDQIRRKFLWHGHKGQHEQARGLYMVNWDIATRPKELGGLGIRDIRFTNYALLMRWMWMWHEQHTAWWKQITLTNCESDRPWEDVHAAGFWKSLKQVQSVFDASVIFRLGNGEKTRFWHDNWLQGPLKFLYPHLFAATTHKDTSISQVRQNGQWLIQHTHLSTMALFEKEQLLHTLQSIQITHQPDTVTWLRHTQTFSVKSAYNYLALRPSPASSVANIWSIKAPLRIQVFAWLLLTNRLTTVDNLVKRGWHLPSMCIMCKQNEETVNHLFQLCPLAKEIREYIYTVFAHNHNIPTKFCTVLSTQMLTDSNEHCEARQWEIVTCFVLWRERCRRIFAAKEFQPLSIVREIKTEWKLWFSNAQPGLQNDHIRHTLFSDAN